MLLATLAVLAGHHDIARQRVTLAQLVETDRLDRAAVLKSQSDWGSAAYHAFHLTYAPPSDFAFAALGRRDDNAWMHRVRMLALEGQIHERDVGNPVFALTGRFDFAFFAAYLLPLVLIVLLHRLHAGERAAGRHDLLEASAVDAAALWRWRAALRASGVFVAAALPLAVAAVWAGTSVTVLLAALAVLAGQVLFWTFLAAGVARWRQSGEFILAVLLAVWLLMAVVGPSASRLAIDRLVPLPTGADILMTQREAVNAAWDLPKSTTMTAFVERHPQWAPYVEVRRPFEWKWYYAFQQVGDQRAEGLSCAYSEGRRTRERWADYLAWLSPPVLLHRSLQRLARTDGLAVLAYEAEVRHFHGQLRAFFYPRLFRQTVFDRSELDAMPGFKPGGHPVDGAEAACPYLVP